MSAQPAPPRDNLAAPAELARPPYLAAPPVPSFELPLLPEAGKSPLSASAPGLLLRRVAVRGNTAIATEELLKVAQPWIQQPVSEADVEALRVALTRYYIDRGYVNSGARIAAGEPQDGVLHVDIVEGRLNGLQWSGLDGLDEAYVKARLWPDAQAPLQMQALRERYQLLLDDPLIQRMNARLLPGDEPGEALLDVVVQRAQPWSMAVRANNYRPASVGEQALVLDAGWRNLTGRGDSVRLTVQPDARAGRLARLGVGWTVPLWHPSTQLSVQWDDGDSTVVEEPMASADIRSRLRSRELTFSHQWVESLRHRAVVGLSWMGRDNQTMLGGQHFAFVAGVPDEGLRTHSLRWWQEYSYRAESQVLALRSSFASTRNNMQALPVSSAGETLQRRAAFWLGQVQYARRLGDSDWQAVARATVQHARRRLVTLDGLAMGGANTVRGWRENQLIRDRGAIVNLELDIPLRTTNAGASRWHLLPFVDYGRGRNVGGAADAIGSVGLALRWRSGAWAADAAWGWRALPRGRHARAGASLQDHGFHLQVSHAIGR